MRSEAAVVAIKKTENPVRREILGKAIGIVKKLRKHKHLHLNNAHINVV